MASFPSCTCAAASSKNSRGTREGERKRKIPKKGSTSGTNPKAGRAGRAFFFFLFFFVLFFLHPLFWSPLV
ncbi:hypothetical protein LY78DRAFT_482823 [Colletotrichum sublineola]|nr:hypothetical protein LY78DRAFT_482823 [Colletotrichum sublineola]